MLLWSKDEGVGARALSPTNKVFKAYYWLRVFDFGCSAKYSVGRVDTRNPRCTPIIVGNRMFG
jgi:hypothetical protein